MSTSAERKWSTIALISFDVRGFFFRIGAAKILRAPFATWRTIGDCVGSSTPAFSCAQAIAARKQFRGAAVRAV